MHITTSCITDVAMHVLHTPHVMHVMQEAGADSEARNQAGDTPLMFACRAGQLGAVARMLKV